MLPSMNVTSATQKTRGRWRSTGALTSVFSVSMLFLSFSETPNVPSPPMLVTLFKDVTNGIEPLLTQAIGTAAIAVLPFRRATTTLRDQR